MKKNYGQDFLFSKELNFENYENGNGFVYSDGSGYFNGENGLKIYIYSDGSGYYKSDDGTDGYKYSDGSGYFNGADGSKGYKYSDGSGYFVDKDGKKTTYYADGDNEIKDFLSDVMYELGSDYIDKKFFSKNEKKKFEEINNNNNSNNNDNKTFIYFFCIMSIVLLFISFMCWINGVYDKPGKDEIQIPISYKEYIGEDYKIVEEQFKSMGFTNIECKPLNDLVTGWINKENSIEKISIGGNFKFEKDDIFSKNDKILITYHSFKKKK